MELDTAWVFLMKSKRKSDRIHFWIDGQTKFVERDPLRMFEPWKIESIVWSIIERAICWQKYSRVIIFNICSSTIFHQFQWCSLNTRVCITKKKQPNLIVIGSAWIFRSHLISSVSFLPDRVSNSRHPPWKQSIDDPCYVLSDTLFDTLLLLTKYLTDTGK